VFKYDFSQWPKTLYNTYVYIINDVISYSRVLAFEIVADVIREKVERTFSKDIQLFYSSYSPKCFQKVIVGKICLYIDLILHFKFLILQSHKGLIKKKIFREPITQISKLAYR
jgi:hypothetical protein